MLCIQATGLLHVGGLAHYLYPFRTPEQCPHAEPGHGVFVYQEHLHR